MQRNKKELKLRQKRIGNNQLTVFSRSMRSLTVIGKLVFLIKQFVGSHKTLNFCHTERSRSVLIN